MSCQVRESKSKEHLSDLNSIESSSFAYLISTYEYVQPEIHKVIIIAHYY